MALLRQSRGVKQPRWLQALACALAVTAVTPAAAQEDTLALAVKATYLFKFIPFVGWPSPIDQSSGMTLCIAGRDPFGSLLDRAAALQVSPAPPVMLRRLAPGSSVANCNTLYAAGPAD